MKQAAGLKALGGGGEVGGCWGVGGGVGVGGGSNTAPAPWLHGPSAPGPYPHGPMAQPRSALSSVAVCSKAPVW